MKRYHFLTIFMSLVLGLTLCLNTGCKKKEEGSTSNTSPVIADEIEPTQAVAQVEETAQPKTSRRPAVEQRKMLGTSFCHKCSKLCIAINSQDRSNIQAWLPAIHMHNSFVLY